METLIQEATVASVVVDNSPYDRALCKAFLLNPQTVWLGGNEYMVQSTSYLNTTYHVILPGDFTMIGAACTCPAGESHVACIHRAAAHIFEVNQEARRDRGLPLFEAVAPELTLEAQQVTSLVAPVAGCSNEGCTNAQEVGDLCQDCYNDWFIWSVSGF